MSRREEPEKAIWGTWEELLLACAVNRHGTKSWDSVAMEIQNRSSVPHLLTAQNCKQTYYDLQRRFMSKDEKTDEREDDSNINNNNDDNNHNTNSNSSNNKKIPWWLDELRKLRVAELRREVQRYDVSIVSLQLKVKMLKEEREQSLKETESSEEKPDLKKYAKTERVKEEGEKEEEEEDKSSPENVAGKCISGDESDRENQSFNSSNSTNPKGSEDRKSGAEEPDEKPEKDEIAVGKQDPVPDESPDGKEVGEGSYDGSSDTIAKGTEVSPVEKLSGEVPVSGESAEFRESFAESKEEEEGVKENSDVQSSASLSRKSRREKITGNSGDSPVTHEICPVGNRSAVKSPPLVDILEIIRSHKYGSIFQRRLVSQETADYQMLIRQHVDLEMVRRKIDEDLYSNKRLEFFRDLLLLFNNAIVFFPNDSKESVAARNLRKIVTKEMANAIQKADHRSREPTPTLPSGPSLSKFGPDPATKRSLSGPIIVCRKRSSISAKAASQAVDEVKKEERPTTADEKPDKSSAHAMVEQIITMKRKRDRSVSAVRSSRTSMNRNGNNNTNGKQNSNYNSVPENAEAKAEKKNASAVAKKRSVANFLNRMKRSSSSPNGSLLDTLKSCVNSTPGSSKRRDQKKRERSDGRKDHVFRRGSAAKTTEKGTSPAKRSVGRPPKRAAPPPPPPPAKRTKDTVEKPSPASRAPRKRGRR